MLESGQFPGYHKQHIFLKQIIKWPFILSSESLLFSPPTLSKWEEEVRSGIERKNKQLIHMIKKEDRFWYVLHTRSRFENVVNEGLIKKNIDVFLPKILVRSKRTDRKKMIRIPLFPGYLFVKTDLNPCEHLEILKTVGAVRLIGSTEGPKPVPDEAVQSLMIMVRTDDAISTGEIYKKGDRVIVVSGPFAGVVGQFIRYGSKGRVVVNIEVLGQYAGVAVSEDDIEKVPEIMS